MDGLWQISDEEVAFLTQDDPQSEEVVMSLWSDGLKLMVVTDGEKGCRYFTKVCFLSIPLLGTLHQLSFWSCTC